MWSKRNRPGRTEPARQVLGMAIPFLVLGAVLLATGPRALVPYLFLVAGVLLAWGLLLRLRQGKPAESGFDSSQHRNTSMLGSQLDSRAGDLLPEPSNRNLRPPAGVWTMQVLRDIEWRRFETVCTMLFAQVGLEARSESHGAEDGIDIWLYSQHAEGPAALVRCRHWLDKPVTTQDVREFHTLMTRHKLLRGTYATSGKFKPQAREFAKSSGINAMDGLGLLALISQRTPQQKKELLSIAYEGEYWRPTCGLCGRKMAERRASRRGKTYWGCVDAPNCAFTLPVRKPS